MATFNKSIAEKINSVVAPIARTLHDSQVDLLGDEINVLRITTKNRDIFGEVDEYLETSIVSNVIIKHPWGNNVRLFSTADEQTGQVNTNTIDLYDLLPIEIQVKFVADYMTQPVSLKMGDIIVEVLEDEFGNKIPLLIQITKPFGMFRSRFITSKRYEGALYRSELTAAIQNAVDTYVGTL